MIRRVGATAGIGLALLSGTWTVQACEQDVLAGQPE